MRADVDVIVTAGPTGVVAAMAATSDKPIVFAALGDAIATGAVTSLAHPDRNVTGFSFLNTESVRSGWSYFIQQFRMLAALQSCETPIASAQI